METALFNANAPLSFTALYSFKDGTVGPCMELNKSCLNLYKLM